MRAAIAQHHTAQLSTAQHSSCDSRASLFSQQLLSADHQYHIITSSSHHHHHHHSFCRLTIIITARSDTRQDASHLLHHSLDLCKPAYLKHMSTTHASQPLPRSLDSLCLFVHLTTAPYNTTHVAPASWCPQQLLSVSDTLQRLGSLALSCDGMSVSEIDPWIPVNTNKQQTMLRCVA